MLKEDFPLLQGWFKDKNCKNGLQTINIKVLVDDIKLQICSKKIISTDKIKQLRKNPIIYQINQ